MLRSHSTLISGLGALAVAFALPALAAAQVSLGPRIGPGIPEVRLVERNAERLELDDETIAAVQKLAAEVSAEDEKSSEQLREVRLKVRDMLDEGSPDEAALMKHAETLGKLSIDGQKRQLKTSLRLRALLTPEQLTQFMELRKTARPQRRRRQPR